MIHLALRRVPFLLVFTFTGMAYSLPDNAYLPDSKRIDSWQCVYGYRRAGGGCEKIGVPSNAYLKDYHDGARIPWECEHGYTKSADNCVEIDVPPNAYLDSSTSSKGWECDFGFEETGANCSAIQIPANAYLDRSSWRNEWKCEHGYIKSGDECFRHELPENAVYVAGHSDLRWQCKRGYMRAIGDQCEFIIVPENGYLSNSYEDRARGWGCERGYIAEENNCNKMEIPVNGYLAGYRGGRVSIHCDRGYKLLNSACQKIAIPVHGYLRESGDSWGCKKPYVRRQSSCVQRSTI